MSGMAGVCHDFDMEGAGYIYIYINSVVMQCIGDSRIYSVRTYLHTPLYFLLPSRSTAIIFTFIEDTPI